MALRPKTLLRALEYVALSGVPCSPRAFAMAKWPNSHGWSKPSKTVVHGHPCGAVMNTAGAALLGRLRAQGLVRRLEGGFVLTQRGRESLACSGSACQSVTRSVALAYWGVPWAQTLWGGSLPCWVWWDGFNLWRWDGVRFVALVCSW